MPISFRRIEIACGPISTMAWDGEDLIDVTSGARYRLDGTRADRLYSSAFSFDRAIALRTGDTLWAVAIATAEPKALLFKNSAVHRELNRSYYFAQQYDYPVTLFRGGNGQAWIAHCPNEFNVLEIEEAESGRRICRTSLSTAEFVSRLQVSPDGQYIMDAGWVWHPAGVVSVHEIAGLIASAGSPPAPVFSSSGQAACEVDPAVFLDNDRVVVARRRRVSEVTGLTCSSRCTSLYGPCQSGGGSRE